MTDSLSCDLCVFISKLSEHKKVKFSPGDHSAFDHFKSFYRKTWTLIGSQTFYGPFLSVLRPSSIFPM